MVFPSVPIYLDPLSWNQQQAHHHPSNGGGGSQGQQLAPPHPEAGMAGSVRPVSMAERARLAKVPQPEAALKCPRCDSGNTKFCYFNNYSLTQPRHFCKTCRRYWTRGGALRSVPVGGGCRRNKRSKASGSTSKSTPTASSADRQSGASSSTTTTAASTGAIPSNIMLPPQLPFMSSSFHSLGDYGGINFTSVPSLDTGEYQAGGSTSAGLEQWRLQQIQQFPFFGGLESPTPAPALGLYPFEGEGGIDATGYAGQVQLKASSSGLVAQMASVKMEDNSRALSLPRQYLSIPGNDQYWGIGGNGGGGGSGATNVSTGAWMTDLSGFNTSSSGGNIL